MEFKTITRLAEIMARQGLTELEVKDKETSIRLCRPASSADASSPAAMAAAEPAASAPAVTPAPAVAAAPKPAAASGVAPVAAPPVNYVTSPMPGTFFSSSAPEAPAFVALGDKVKPDTVVGIVEAMKVMNEVKAEVTGTITKIYVANGSPVEFGQRLFEIH